DVQDEARRAIEGAAVRRQVANLGEDLQGLDGADHGQEDDRRVEERQGDVAEALPRCRTVERCRLVEDIRDALEPGEKDDYLEAEAVPDGHDRDGDERLARAAEEAQVAEPESVQG